MEDQKTRTNEETGKQIEQNVEERCSLVRDECIPSSSKGVQSEAPASVRFHGVIHEYAPGKASTIRDSHDSQRPRECESSPSSPFTMPKYSRRSSTSSSDSVSPSHQIDMGVDCAGIVLNCLFCRFYDLFLMLPESCERATYNCCPAYKHFTSSVENTPINDCFCNIDSDCGLCDICQETGECLELAMEISEICYH